MKALMRNVSIQKKDWFTPLFLLFLFVMLFYTNNMNGQRNDGQFVVVLDAGHGGHDPGNLGNGYLEKNIALNIVLKAGEILGQTSDIKVLYTRKDDTFVDLYVRGEIANKANADLFVSVHCDSHTSNAHGAGTFVLGLHANKQNFEIAKKENSVIYLEDNYESRYADYDINSPESVIGLTIMQEEFLDQSISLAKGIQYNFSRKLKRKDREVKQAGFIVLHQTFMPSVLVETGFLTNDDEGAYLNSKRGQSEIGTSIAEAIIGYMGGVQSSSSQITNTASTPAPDPKDEVITEEKVVDEAPSMSSEEAAEQFAKNPGANPITKKEAEEKPENIEVTENVVKEVIRDSATETVTDLVKQEPRTPQVVKEETPKPQVEIVAKEAEKEKKKIITSAPTEGNNKNIIFKVQLMASTKDIALEPANFGGLNKLSKEQFKQFRRYMYGSTDSYAQAKLLKSNADAKGYSTSYIVAYKDEVRIPTPEAIKLVSE